MPHTSSRPGGLDKIKPTEAIPDQGTWNDEDDGFFLRFKKFQGEISCLAIPIPPIGRD